MAMNKVPTLDGSGKVRDKHLPDRLSAASQNAAYATKTVETTVATKADKSVLPAAKEATGARLPMTMISGAQYTPGGGTSTTDVVVGTLNYYVTTDGAAGFANWHRQNSITPQNMIGKGLMLMLKVTNGQNLQYLTVIASSDATGTGYFTFKIPVPNGGKSPLREGEWVPVYIPWSDMYTTTVVGTPDPASIVMIKITPTDIGGGNTVRLDIGSQFGVYTDPATSGTMMIACDDSWLSATDVAMKLASVGWRGVLHPIVERLDTAGCLTTAQVQRLQNLYGWEIGAHCMTNAQHVSMVGQTQAQMDQMLRDLRAWQRSIGAESNAFAYPIGPFDKNAVTAVSAHYGWARTNDERTSPSRLPKPLQAASYALSSTANSLTSMKALVDQVAANKSLLTITVHNLLASGTPGTNEWLLSDFNALIDYAISKGIKNVVPSQVLALK